MVHSSTAEGQPIDIIQIAQKQERPIFLTKNFGKVKANEVCVRLGSSSAIATPDQIAAMVKADQTVSLGEVRIALEWADAKTRKRLSSEVTLTSIRLVDPPPPPPKPAPRPPTTLEKKIGASPLFNPSMFLPPPVATNIRFSMDDGPSFEERKEYAQSRALFRPVRLWLKNLGARNASNVNVKITIPKVDGLLLSDFQSLPKKPQGRLSMLMSHSQVQWDTSVDELAGAWVVETNAKTIQPQDEFWSSDRIYIASGSDQTIDAVATIFADDLAKPIEVPLKIHTKVVEREISPSDFEGEDD